MIGGDLFFPLLLLATISVAWDLYTYGDRQKKWEKAHPGQTYIRNYRKLIGQPVQEVVDK